MIDKPDDEHSERAAAFVRTLERKDGHWIIRIDPHGGTCHGQHDIIIHIMPVSSVNDPNEVNAPQWHFSVTWGPSVFLSAGQTALFASGLLYATRLIEQYRADTAKGIPLADLFRHGDGAKL